MTSKQRTLFLLGALFLAGGLYTMIDALPAPGPEAEVLAAQEAQAVWARKRSIDIVTQRPWDGTRKPPDAPGTPMDLSMMIGGAAALLSALGLALYAARRP